MKKILLTALPLVLLFSSISLDLTGGAPSFNQKELDNAAAVAEETVTMKDAYNFFITKKEHYPISDAFIEKYQQKDGGYIDLALETGILVDKTQHSPNQKWHFFTSWYDTKVQEHIEKGKPDFNTLSAKSSMYNVLLCPELLLWIYEAAGVEPSKVWKAKEIAEKARVNKTNLSTMASEIRKIILWEYIETPILNFMKENPNIDPTPEDTKYKVTYNTSNDFNITGLETEYAPDSDVTFTVNVTNPDKAISAVKANNDVLTPTSGTTYSFKMPKGNVTLTVSLKNINGPELEEGTAYTYNFATTSTSKFTEASAIYNAFKSESEEGIISSIDSFENIYGGGTGGSGENRWTLKNILKFGSTSLTGNLTLNLTQPVNKITITGYIHKATCNLKVGDAETISKTNLTVASKAEIDSANEASITIDFTSTTSLYIGVETAVALYATSITLYVG